MILLYFIIAYAICFGMAFYFNKSKKFTSNINVLQLNAIEAGITTAAIALLYMHGFYATWFGPFLFFFLLLGIILLDYYFVDWTLQDGDVLLETTKNSIILFTKTVLPFVLFLTIFRFWNPILQLLTALTLSALIYLVSIPLQQLMKPKIDALYEWFGESGDSKFLLLFVAAAGVASIFFFSFLVQVPFYKTNQQLNLTAYNGYYNIDGFPVDIQNDFRENIILNIQANELDITVIDYVHDEEYLYLYDQENIYVFDIEVGELKHTLPIFDTSSLDPTIPRDRLPQKLTITPNGDILLVDLGRVYVVQSTSTTRLQNISMDSTPFQMNGKQYIISKTAEMKYTIYEYNNQQITSDQEIDLSNTSFRELLVINGDLFYANSSLLIRYDDSSMEFNRESETAYYDSFYNTMYYVRYYKEAVYMRYYREPLNNQKEQKTILSRHNPILIPDEEYKYFVDLNQDSGFIEIMDNNFTFTNIYHHTKRGRFSFGPPSTTSYVVDYQLQDGHLEYVQVDQLGTDTFIKLAYIERDIVALPLAFYTHYSAGFFLPILISLFIPTSNYSITVTITGFNEKTYKKEDSV